MPLPNGDQTDSYYEMSLSRVPNFLIDDVAALPELIFARARSKGYDRDEAQEIIRLVPTSLRELTCFLDRLTWVWRYDYGSPIIKLPSGKIGIAPNTFDKLDRLFDVIECARRRLESKVLRNYLQRLEDPEKHRDFLTEFDPIVRLDPTVVTYYEVSGYGDGNRTIDWLITEAGVSLLLEVKNRTFDLAETFCRVDEGSRGPGGIAPAPNHDPRLLFRSIESKFIRRDPTDFIQGAWITTALKQEEDGLRAAFTELDPSRVHIAVLATREGDAYVLSHSVEVKKKALQLLRLRETPSSKVFHRGD
jgi:hypothetical protein